MSATFFLKFRGLYVRVIFQTGKSVAEVVERDQATPFISESEAWLAMHQHHLNPDFCDVVPASEAMKEAA